MQSSVLQPLRLLVGFLPPICYVGGVIQILVLSVLPRFAFLLLVHILGCHFERIQEKAVLSEDILLCMALSQ